ncbi:VCBS repeat-containing protein [Rheinheimera metallidurans]|uniref:FG-GAP repeat domain-containing protein n=1 Tax=Rheinheimera metallidurans TaxID=2925781 RepID=UPI003001F100
MRAGFAVGFVFVAMHSVAAEQVRFDKVDIPLAHPANGSLLVLPKKQQLLVSGFNQFERWLSQVSLADFSVTPIDIPNNAQFFSSAILANISAEQLVFLTTDGVSLRAENGAIKPLVTSSSLYRVLDPSRLREHNFVIHLGSELSDFLIPDFNHLQLYRQQPDGQFVHYALKTPALLESWNKGLNYQARPYYLLDTNMDGLLDIVVVQQGQFYAFLQQSDGAFLTDAQALAWPVSLSTEQQSDQRNDAGSTYAGKHIDSLNKITDIDGDGVLDIVVNREQFIDALERKNSFRVHFGEKTATGLRFSAQPDTTINTDSSPLEVRIGDINGDGKQDFYITSTHFGVGTIIRVLLRGSANLDVDFYLLDEQRRYKTKADFRQRATIDVSIGNFRFDMPLLQLTDLHNDGKSSLLIGDGLTKLKFYLPDNKRLFQRSSVELSVDLPRDAKQVKVVDVNNDNKQDIILPFSGQDNEQQGNRLILLLNSTSDKS